MKSYLSLAWKELKAQRVTAILILIAVILSSLMTTVIGQSIGILQAMRVQQAERLNGSRYATLHQLTQQQAQTLHDDPRLTDVGDVLYLGSMGLGSSSLKLSLREYHDDALAMYPSIGKIKEGRLPEAAKEVALPEDALQYLDENAAVGGTIRLTLTVSTMDGLLPEVEYTADFTLTGILESSYLGYSSGTVQGIVGKGSAEVLLPAAYRRISTDFKTQSGQDFQRIVRELAETLQVDAAFVQYNPVLLNALGIAYDADEDSDTGSGFPFMAAACVLVGVLVLLAAGLVIYNILKISISKRVREYGTLRAIGAQRGQVYRLVSVQLLLLCGIGIPVGLLLGVLSAKGVLIAATGALNPDIFMANSAQELNSAISGAAEVKPIMLLASIAVTLTFAILLLVMSITVFVALQSFTGLLDASSAVQDMYTGDYALTNEDAGISAEGVEKLRANDAVAQLSTTRLSVFMPDQTLPFDTNLSLQGHETLQLTSVDEAQLFRFAPTLSAQDKQALLDGTGCLVKNPIALSYGGETVQQTSLAVGDVVKLGDKELRVAALLDSPVTFGSSGFTNGVQILVSDALYCELTGSDCYAEVCPTLKKDADTTVFEAWLDSWCGENPGTQWLSYRQSSQEMAESFAQIKMLCWVLIALIGVIGVLNIINTVYSNIHTRIDEIGMQRAIGMSAASLYKTFLWEGAYYGIFASVIGAVLGYVCCIFVGAAQTDTLQLVAVPVAAILEAAAVSVAACLAATAIPLRTISRMSIVESIETGE